MNNVPTLHNEANFEDIADVVLMPGDPIRAKLIADKYLSDVKCFNKVRGMYGFTGQYKGRRVSVMGSGMGIPSMGIYSYELFKFYDVKKIIRIGSCGVYTSKFKLLDTLIVENSFTKSNYAFEINNDDCHFINSSSNLNNILKETANELNINLISSNVLCGEAFDYYIKDLNNMIENLPKKYNLNAAEMESFALLYNAKLLNKEASCLLSVVDSHAEKTLISSEDREKNLDNMIKIALESTLKF